MLPVTVVRCSAEILRIWPLVAVRSNSSRSRGISTSSWTMYCGGMVKGVGAAGFGLGLGFFLAAGLAAFAGGCGAWEPSRSAMAHGACRGVLRICAGVP